MAFRIRLDRLRADLESLNRFGAAQDAPGVNRVSYSDADMAGRRWFMDRLTAAGLAARMDGVGNVVGRWDAGEGAAVVAGSHLDTVPAGGRFDGALGAVAALEAVRTLKEAGLAPRRPIEVIATAEEEGRFGGMLGSQAIVGEAGADWIAGAADDRGERLADALGAQGLDASAAGVARADIALFLELHIEQGPRLEAAGLPIGIVTGVSGVFNWAVTMTGAANHSGTTPMDMRRDAFRGLAAFGVRIDDIAARAGGPETRLTVGKAELSPNFPHSIAGEARFSIIGRDIDPAGMRRLADACRAELASAAETHGLTLAVAEQSWLPPNPLDASVADRLAALAAAHGLPHMRMTSGAGHDAQTFGRHVPAGLIFTPSRGGVSHSPDEDTDWADIEQAANLLTAAIAAYAHDRAPPAREGRSP